MIKNNLFSTPFWIKQIDCKKISLSSTGFEKNFLSETITSLSISTDKNEISKEGLDYLLQNILECLKEQGITKIKLSNIWRNIYKDSFQETHFHKGAHFSFVAYEQINKPQTIFFNPGADLIQEKNLEDFFSVDYFPKVKTNDLIVFPAYIKHMVKRTDEAMTISGNINIIK
jgi:hypothetical protein